MADIKDISGQEPTTLNYTQVGDSVTPEVWTQKSNEVLRRLLRASGALSTWSAAARLDWDEFRASTSTEDMVPHLQLMAATIHTELQEAHDLWDSFLYPPCGGADLGLMAAERFVGCIDGMLWVEQGLGETQSLPKFSEMAGSADIAAMQLQQSITALEAAIKAGPPAQITTRASTSCANPPNTQAPTPTPSDDVEPGQRAVQSTSATMPPPFNAEAERQAAGELKTKLDGIEHDELCKNISLDATFQLDALASLLQRELRGVGIEDMEAYEIMKSTLCRMRDLTSILMSHLGDDVQRPKDWYYTVHGIALEETVSD